jgi:hypothetical protein
MDYNNLIINNTFSTRIHQGANCQYTIKIDINGNIEIKRKVEPHMDINFFQ